MNITSAIDYFTLLLRQLAAIDGDTLLISNEERVEVPDDVWTTMVQLKIVQQVQHAKSVICDGCEENCVRPAHIYLATVKSPARAFVVCDMREDVGRVNVDFERLNQWQVSEQQLAEMVRDLLGHSTQPVVKDAGSWSLGVYCGKKHRAVVGLNLCSEARLIMNDTTLSLIELIGFSNGRLELDTTKITQLIDLGLAPAGKVQKNELRKSKTQTRNENWNKEYQRLKRANSNKSDTWISQQIAKLPIADGKDSETIRKNMK